MAKREDIDLWFEDECHFQQHGSRCAMWVPPEETDPVVLHAPTRKSLALFGAVRSDDGMMVVQPEPKFNAASFLQFLKKLSRRRRKGHRMVVVVDNASWHRARTLQEWLSERKRWLTIDFLPPYSPELNSIERVWKLTRRICTHNQYFEFLQDLVDTVLSQLHAWETPNDTLRRLCAVT